MADNEKTNTPSSKATSLLNPTGAMEPDTPNEKSTTVQGVSVSARPARDEEVEDMDALIDELESEDGNPEDEEVEVEDAVAGAERVIPDEFLQTDTRRGLSEAEVLQRRKKFGANQMKEEKENLILKFLGYFIGPIQFVMEVRILLCHLKNELSPSLSSPFSTLLILYSDLYRTQTNCSLTGCCYPCCWSRRLG